MRALPLPSSTSFVKGTGSLVIVQGGDFFTKDAFFAGHDDPFRVCNTEKLEMRLKTTATGVCLDVFARCSRRSSDQRSGLETDTPLGAGTRIVATRPYRKAGQAGRRAGSKAWNSNRPPSSDPPYRKTKKAAKGAGKPGAKPGHKGHQRSFLTPTETVPVPPMQCNCGCHEFENLRPFYTHQHIELPEIVMQVTHFVLLEGDCAGCGKTSRGVVPEGFSGWLRRAVDRPDWGVEWKPTL
jgi:hypothetical protein